MQRSSLGQPDKQSPPLGDFGKEHLPFLLDPCKKRLSRKSLRFEEEEGLWTSRREDVRGHCQGHVWMVYSARCTLALDCSLWPAA